MLLRCDLFCRVIDNFGDIGVCWRLARQLAAEHGVAVTLWVDDLAVFARLAPGLDTQTDTQTLDGLCVRHWRDEAVTAATPGDLVIEAFACELPPAFIHAMKARARAPVWVNLEYLSAEDWVEGCHGLASPHPATGLAKYFWFPGFTTRTGGLLREAGLLPARLAFQADTNQQADFWAGLGLPEAPGFARRLSLFAYENPAIAGLLTALAADRQTSLLVVPEGRALTSVAEWAGLPRLTAGQRLVRGNLSLAVIPLLAHADFDRLLWACELNAVRGEDSVLRAQWAGRPLLWHIYPQEDAAHLDKLFAFTGRLTATVHMPKVWAEAQAHWNQAGSTIMDWPGLLAALPAMTAASEDWCRHLAGQTDLAAGVMHFYRSRVE